MLEDPISQLTASLEVSHTKPSSKQPVRRLDVTLREGIAFGSINSSDFRMPKVQSGPHHPPYDHSDGFVGLEAVPIRKLMPLRRRMRRQPLWDNVMVRMDQLTLVAERQQDVQNQRPARRCKKKFRISTPTSPMREVGIDSSHQVYGLDGHPNEPNDAKLVLDNDPMLLRVIW